MRRAIPVRRKRVSTPGTAGWGQQDGNLVTEAAMLDVLFVVLTIVFFALGAAYIVACDRLQ